MNNIGHKYIVPYKCPERDLNPPRQEWPLSTECKEVALPPSHRGWVFLLFISMQIWTLLSSLEKHHAHTSVTVFSILKKAN